MVRLHARPQTLTPQTLSDDLDHKANHDTPTLRANITPSMEVLAERAAATESEVVKVCKSCMESAPDFADFCSECGEELVSIRRMPDAYLSETVGGKYRIVEKIGQGGMGVVYLAKNDELGQKVAVKFLSKKFADDENLVLRFLNEAKSYCRVNHPNAVTLLEYGQHEDGALYIITEFVDGQNVTETMQSRGPLSPDLVLNVGIQIAEVLSAAHHQGVIHRDLKPDNVMLMPSSRGRLAVKVLDFGIAKIVDEENGPNTETGSVFGTPEFMSPEQARGDEVDPRSDIYSLGVILFYTLTGKLPFRGKNKLVVLNMQLNEPPPRPSELLPDLDVPPRLEAVIMKCLNKKRSARYETADDLLEALEDLRIPGGFLTDKTSIATAPTTPPPDRAGRSGVDDGGGWGDEFVFDSERRTPGGDDGPGMLELESIDLQRENPTTDRPAVRSGFPHGAILGVVAAGSILVFGAWYLSSTDDSPTTQTDVQDLVWKGHVEAQLSSAAGMLADGNVEAARAAVAQTREWVADEGLPDSLREQRREISSRVEQLDEQKSQLDAHVVASRCMQAQELLQEIRAESVGLADRLHGKVDTCKPAFADAPSRPGGAVEQPAPVDPTEPVQLGEPTAEPGQVDVESQENPEPPPQLSPQPTADSDLPPADDEGADDEGEDLTNVDPSPEPDPPGGSEQDESEEAPAEGEDEQAESEKEKAAEDLPDGMALPPKTVD